MTDLPVLFPAYIGRRIWRTLACLFPDYLLLESGERLGFSTTEELIHLLFTENLLTFVDGITELPDELIQLAIEHGDVYCTREGQVRSLRLRGKRNTTRWFIDRAAWEQQTLSLEFLQHLRSLFTLAKTGTVNTPGALGMTLLRRSWREQYGDEWKAHRHERPSEGVCQWMREVLTGSRSDLEESARGNLEITACIEIDRKNAFGAELCEVPTGPTVGFAFGDTESFATYVAQCTVTIGEPLCYGLFPFKDGNETVYPTLPGWYETTLFKEEIEFLREEGLTVEVKAGHGWYAMTNDPALFVKTIEQLRDTYPDLADEWKGALVKTIGRLGMESKSYQLTTEETDIHVSRKGRVYDWFVDTLIDKRPATMPHWFWFILMKARLALTKEAYLWKKKELFLGSNTDAVFLSPQADMQKYALATGKHFLPSGAWSWTTRQALTGQAMFPAKRHLVSQNKIARPGKVTQSVSSMGRALKTSG